MLEHLNKSLHFDSITILPPKIKPWYVITLTLCLTHPSITDWKRNKNTCQNKPSPILLFSKALWTGIFLNDFIQKKIQYTGKQPAKFWTQTCRNVFLQYQHAADNTQSSRCHTIDAENGIGRLWYLFSLYTPDKSTSRPPGPAHQEITDSLPFFIFHNPPYSTYQEPITIQDFDYDQEYFVHEAEMKQKTYNNHFGFLFFYIIPFVI